MDKNLKTREIIIGGLFLAIGILLPMLFHTVGMMGKIFLPMHIPVLIAGYLLNPLTAFILGFITPLLSSVLTGMPIFFPMAIIMAFELACYSMFVSLMRRKFKLSVITSLITSMLMGRVVAFFVVFIMSSLFGIKLNPLLFIKTGIITGLPGIVVQLIFIPTVIMGIIKYNKTKNIRI